MKNVIIGLRRKMKRSIWTKTEAVNAARDIVWRLMHDKISYKDEIMLTWALKADKDSSTLLRYLKDIKRLVNDLIKVIEAK